MCTNC